MINKKCTQYLENLINKSINNFTIIFCSPGKRKVHFLLEDGRELVEEYHLETNVVTRRAWREKGKLGQDVGWVVEIGDPEPKKEDTLETSGIRESSSAVRKIID